MQAVTAYGTASGTTISGVETAGKTGTTTSNTDIWFCGVTPEYSAAVWVGYEHNYTLDGLYGRDVYKRQAPDERGEQQRGFCFGLCGVHGHIAYFRS